MNLFCRVALFACIAALLVGGAVSADGPAVRAVSVDEMTIKQPGGQARSLDSLLKDVAQYKFGDNRASLLAAEQLTLALGAANEAARKFLAAKYVALLDGPATADGKRFVCRQLGLIGTAAEVPALESLLTNEQFAFAARSALERIPGDESLAALRRAAEKAKGMAKAGLIQSLGVRGDQKAIPLLTSALKDPHRVVAAAVVVSLGQIGGTEALDILLYSDKPIAADLGPQWYESILLVAKGHSSPSRTRDALAIWLLAADRPAGVRGAAMLALLELRGENGADLLVNTLSGSDPLLQSIAILRLAAQSPR